MKKVCKYQRLCSGCTQLDVPYEQQLKRKEELVRRELAAVLKRQPGALRPIVPSPQSFGYRSSIKHCLSHDLKRRTAIGLFRKGTKTVIDIPDCPAQAPRINELLARLFYKNPHVPAPFYTHERNFQSGRLKFVTVRYSPPTDQFGVIISHTGVPRDSLVRWLKKTDLSGVSVHESELTKVDRDQVLGATCRHLAGAETFVFRVAGHDFDLPPSAFFQANAFLADDFIAHITDFGAGRGTLFDLYGGFGAYSFASAARFKEIFLVDSSADAISAAAQNAAKYDYGHLRPIASGVEDFLESAEAVEAAKRVTDVIVNPPRAGVATRARSALATKNLPRLERLVYVSCNAKTLGPDLVDFTSRLGFALESVTPFDMFPQTGHVEVVAKLRRR